MAIKVGNFDLNLYALQTRQALEAYQTQRPESQLTAQTAAKPATTPQPIASEDLSGVLSDEERQSLAEAFGGSIATDNGYRKNSNAFLLKGSRVDLTL